MIEPNKLLAKIKVNQCSDDEIFWILSNVELSKTDLLEALKLNRSIRSLNLGNSKILDEGCKLLYELLTVNNSLTELSLEYNFISDKGAKLIAKGLKENKMLQLLSLDENAILDAGFAAIFDTLKFNQSLTSLSLYRCRISFTSPIPEFEESLQQNRSLKSLNLCNNNLKATACISISKVLKVNRGLTELNLDHNYLNYHAHRIFEALQQNYSLTTLRISWCALGQVSALGIANMLRKNTSLTSLKLISNELEAVGCRKIVMALEENRSMIDLELGKTNLDDSEHLINPLLVQFMHKNSESYKESERLEIHSITGLFLAQPIIDIIFYYIGCNNNHYKYYEDESTGLNSSNLSNVRTVDVDEELPKTPEISELYGNDENNEGEVTDLEPDSEATPKDQNQPSQMLKQFTRNLEDVALSLASIKVSKFRL